MFSRAMLSQEFLHSIKRKVNMKKVLIASFIFLIVLISFFLYKFGSRKSLPLTYLKRPCEIIVFNKTDTKQIYVTLEFKNAGVLQNLDRQHGMSVLISKLLFRKINGLTVAETSEKLQQLGITNLSVNGLSDSFVVSFSVVKDQFKPAIKFLISGLGEKFSENDLSYVKELFPFQINPENSRPDEILLDKLYQNLYPNHVYGKNVTGSSDSIAKITLGDIDNFIKNNLALNNLRIYYAGAYSIENLRILIDEISKFLSKKPIQSKVNNLKDIKVNCANVEIRNSNIRDIRGVATGIRLDGLSKREKAALYIIADVLFNKDNGEFLNTDIPMNFSYSIDDRKLSTILVLTAFVQEGDLDKYLKRQSDFLSKLNLSQLKNLELSKKDFIENQQIYSLRSLRNTLVFVGLPFEDCDEEIYQKILQKIQQKEVRSTVSILEEETSLNQ